MKSICNRLGALLVVAGAMALNGVAWGEASWYTVLELTPNPAVVTDAVVRQKIVESGCPWRVRDNSSGIEMLLIPGGTFTMGEEGGWNTLVHTVTLTKAFYLGKTEVTQAQWQAKMGSNPSYFKSYSDSPSRPVETVSWNDIAGFNTATGLRLPSEAEWEYACRGGTTTAFHSMPGYPNGTNDVSLLGNIAWYGSNSGRTTHAVAGLAANAFGMYDMLGNVWEWCIGMAIILQATRRTRLAQASGSMVRPACSAAATGTTTPTAAARGSVTTCLPNTAATTAASVSRGRHFHLTTSTVTVFQT